MIEMKVAGIAVDATTRSPIVLLNTDGKPWTPDGFRSSWGAEASAIRTSILATARKRGQNLLDAFRAVAGPSPLHALPARS